MKNFVQWQPEETIILNQPTLPAVKDNTILCSLGTTVTTNSADDWTLKPAAKIKLCSDPDVLKCLQIAKHWIKIYFAVSFDGSDKGSLGLDDNSCSAFDINEDSNLSMNDGNNDDNEVDNSYASNEDDDNDDNELDDDENDNDDNDEDGGNEAVQSAFEGDESNLVPSLAR